MLRIIFYIGKAMKKNPKLAASVCPVCKVKLDAAMETSCADETIQPRPDDYTVCAYCASFLVYENDMSLRVLTQDEIGDMPSDIRSMLTQARKCVEELRDSRGLPNYN